MSVKLRDWVLNNVMIFRRGERVEYEKKKIKRG
jgi:hypothetical protein